MHSEHRTALSHFQKGIRSCFVPIPNTIVRNFMVSTKMYHLNTILFRSNMNCSYSFMVLLRCHIWPVTDSLCFVYILPSKLLNDILFIKQYFQIKITIFNAYSIIPEVWNIQDCKCLVQWHSCDDIANAKEYYGCTRIF